MSTAIIWGFTMSFLVYTNSIIKGTQHRMSGKPIYDFFMGAPLNPRIGPVDLKMWAECRVPWPVLFFTSVSCALKQYEMRGYVSGPVAFMVLAHFLYTNACQKGEECIPTSFDMFYEKDGKSLLCIEGERGGIFIHHCLQVSCLFSGTWLVSPSPMAILPFTS